MAEDYNAANVKHVRGRKDIEKRELIKNEDAFRYVMGDVRGRNFVWHLLSSTGLYDDSFTGNSSTFYNEGKRAVGLRLITELEDVCPSEFITMWQEHLLKQNLEKKEDEALRTESNKEGDF